jgi:predicted DNA-binding protein with PD1-like motif
MGKKNKVLTGCLRGNSKVFLVIEAVVLELQGIRANKEIDPETGLNLLRIVKLKPI